jgi:DNA-binding Lrp family transcriptional regulator
MSRTGALHQTAQVLSDFDRRLINALQGDFPLSSTPFDDIAARLDCQPEEVMEGVESLLERGVITRFGPLFNIEQLGGTFSLCALHVPEERFEEVTELVNACPEVAHNYRRDHHWNMWLPWKNWRPLLTISLPAVTARVSTCPRNRSSMLDCALQPETDGELRRLIVLALQEGLPVSRYPYRDLAYDLDIGEDTLMRHIQAITTTPWATATT